MFNIKYQTKGLYGIALALIVGSAIFIYYYVNSLISTSNWVIHTQKVIGHGQELGYLLAQMETTEHSFLMTGDEELFELYHHEKKKFKKFMTQFKNLVHDNPSQIELLEEIQELTNQWHKKAATVAIAIRKQIPVDAIDADYFQTRLTKGVGKGILDEIKVVLTELHKNMQMKTDKNAEILILTIANALIVQESSQRMFLMTGKEEFLDPYYQEQNALDQYFVEIEELLAGDISHKALINRVKFLAQKWIEQVAIPEIEAREKMNKNHTTLKNVIAFVEQGVGKKIMVQIRTLLEKFIDKERALLKVRQQKTDAIALITMIVTVLGNLFVILVGVLAFLFLARQDWVKNGLTQLNDRLRGEQNTASLAKNIISFLTTYLNAKVGLFYLLKESVDEQPSYLQVIASYAYTTTENMPTQFFIGEGLVGQAVLEQKPLSCVHSQEEFTHIIQSGLAKAAPRYVIMIPFLYENTVIGVIEIGSSKVLNSLQRDFLEQVMPSIGIAVNTANSRTQMQALLDQSQRQAEKMQTQQTEMEAQQKALKRKQMELQQINELEQSQREELISQQEELQHRNEELQAQAEQLQTQQEELRQSNEVLEERTKELERQKSDIQQKNIDLEKTQTEMEKAKDAIETKARELELANKYKSEFLANMSHELRTPLNSLLILSQLLADNKDGNLSDKQVEYAKTVNSAGSDLLTLINDILDLSKVEAGKIEIHVEDVLLSDLIEAIALKFRHLAEDKGLDFPVTIAEDLPPVLHTDGQRLKQIINNLLSNAFKFTNEGKVQLTIQRPTEAFLSQIKPEDNLSDPAKMITISIADTGIGIPKDKQKFVFEAFRQADGTTSRSYGGTGLGLSISRQFAKLLSGELYLHSEEKSGSTFTLYFPENAPEQSQDNEVQEEKPLDFFQPTVAASFPDVTEATSVEEMPNEEIIDDDRFDLIQGDKTLLIIEDDNKFSDILIELAREKGFKCIVAQNGRIGLQLAVEYKPNAIILDVTLPQIDGWAVMDKLKNTPDTRHIPVHFISGADQDKNAKQMGAIGYLQKPVNTEQLGDAFKKIEQFLIKTVKTLLVVTSSEPHQQKILKLVENDTVQTTLAMTTNSALQHLKTTSFDCVILDMGVEQGIGNQLLEQMRKDKKYCQTPVIIYAERDLTSTEEALLQQCAENLTVKSVKSSERLLDEAYLFLHQIEANLPLEQRNMLQMVHDKETVFAYKKVLIVDDDMRNAFTLATMLEEKNMEVVAASNGHEALELLDEHDDIAIVLMDIMMPEMDGYEAMQKIRAQPIFYKLPIIALTAKAMKGDKTKCIEAGANDYLSKPVNIDQLLSLMRVWLYR
ncbi:response regulator [Candidatus Parabeggiatoa sp. HSG14]|uniref:response regulator n=1 Tax=Candidatus Parabeggiatoa sp. HSG14 TaxID=3055593 RepID=UPI0025A787DC|nr:response regulator [Thiotrichales bacterium HSG14]